MNVYLLKTTDRTTHMVTDPNIYSSKSACGPYWMGNIKAGSLDDVTCRKCRDSRAFKRLVTILETRRSE